MINLLKLTNNIHHWMHRSYQSKATKLISRENRMIHLFMTSLSHWASLNNFNKSNIRNKLRIINSLWFNPLFKARSKHKVMYWTIIKLLLLLSKKGMKTLKLITANLVQHMHYSLLLQMTIVGESITTLKAMFQ